ncbi:MAG: hypothetical protein LBP98_05150 [Tannerella sp.]|nr:hypothetical protein [Tannerella sp.]
MKRFVVISGLALALGLFHAGQVEAQAVSVHVNIDLQPAWGPAGYDYAEFYYFPELNIYFDVSRALFYYLDGRKWISGFYLPLSYHKYDLYRMYKVVLNHDPNPWIRNRLHRRDYDRFCHNHSQVAIRSAKEHRYNKARSNTRAWVAPNNGRKPNSNQYRDGHRDRHREQDYTKPPSKQKRPEQSGRNSKPDKEKKRNRSSGR